VAKGYAAERVNEAKGDVARFNSVYSEYRKAPDVTKQRLYYEMMEDVFKGEKNIELIDKHFTNFLPLKNLVSSSTPVPMPASEPAPAPAPAPAAAPAQTTESAQ